MARLSHGKPPEKPPKPVKVSDKEMPFDAFKNMIDTETCIVVYFADWCPHCKSFLPQIKALQKDHPDRNVQTCDADSLMPEAASNADNVLGVAIEYLPMIVEYVDGKATVITKDDLLKGEGKAVDKPKSSDALDMFWS